MKKVVVLGVMLVFFLTFLVSLGSINAYSRCINSSYVMEDHVIRVNGENITIEVPDFCPNGCDELKNACIEPYNISGEVIYMSLIFYILLFFIALGSLGFGAIKKHIAFCIFATVLLSVLALQSFAIDTVLRGTQFASFTMIFVLLLWFLTIVSVFITLLGIISYFRKGEGENREVQI